MLGKYLLWAGVLALLIAALLGSPPKSHPAFTASRLTKHDMQ